MNNMRLKLLLIILFSISCCGFAQDKEKIESLLKKLENTEQDTLRVSYLDNLWGLTAYSDPKAAIAYAKEAIEVSKAINFIKGEARGYQRLGIAYSNSSQYKKSNIAYKKALRIYSSSNDRYRMGLMNYNIAINYKDKAVYDSTLFYNSIAEALFKAVNDSLNLANTAGLRGSVYYEKGQLLLALESTLKEVEMFRLLKDTLRYTDAIRTLASIQQSKGNLEQAVKNFHECINLYKRYNDNYFLSVTYRDLGMAYLNAKPIIADSARVYLEKSIEIAKENSMDYQESAALAMLGKLFNDKGEHNRAESILQRSIYISQNIGNSLSESSALLELAVLYSKRGQFSKAIDYAQKGLDIAQEKGLLDNVSYGYKSLYNIHKNQGNSKKALANFEQHRLVADSIYSIQQANRINELQILHETEKKESQLLLQEQEIESLNATAKNDRLTIALYGFGMFSLIIISLAMYFGFKQRIKRNKIEREKQEAIYKQEIEFKQKELASQTLHLVQKNTFIQELKSNLEKIKNSPERFKVEFRRLVMLLKKESAEDRDWEVFKSYFSEVHNNFDTKLKSISEDITEKDIRLASFLRMNLSTKEIASMLNVQPDSVKKSKYRLKNKLTLSKDEDLTQFLNTL